MPDQQDGNFDAVRLNEDAARRLIQRATELDASLAGQSSVAELREAARGAGISDDAFQRALDEVRNPPVQPNTQAAWSRLFVSPRMANFIAVFALVAAVTLIAFGALVFFTQSRQPIVSEPATQQQSVAPATTPVPRTKKP